MTDLPFLRFRPKAADIPALVKDDSILVVEDDTRRVCACCWLRACWL